MLDGIIPFDDLPKYDQYHENYVLETEANLVKQSKTGLWEKEVQFHQLENRDQQMHISYGDDEENVENLEVSGEYLPLCFISF